MEHISILYNPTSEYDPARTAHTTVRSPVVTLYTTVWNPVVTPSTHRTPDGGLPSTHRTPDGGYWFYSRSLSAYNTDSSTTVQRQFCQAFTKPAFTGLRAI